MTTRQKGFALVATMMLLALVMSLLVGYYSMTQVDITTTRSTIASTQGFYAAEAGSNLRAHLVRQVFEGYNRPSGTSPDQAAADRPCTGTNLGDGDYACVNYDFGPRTAETWLVEPPGNPSAIVIPRGEPFQNLNAQEYRYIVHSASRDRADRPEALLEVHFKSRLVPMFQFAAFYDKDLEILPGPAMTLGGPVHTNGDLYLGSNALLAIQGQVTTVGELYHGRKDTGTCPAGDASVIDPVAGLLLPDCVAPRTHITQDELDPWNGMIETGIEPLEVPPPEALDPESGQIYWDRADLRLTLDLNGPPVIQVRLADETVDAALTAALDGCGGAAEHTDEFFNNREGTTIEMLDVDVRALLDCIHVNALMGPGKGLDDTSEGGLVWHLGVNGPDSDGFNNYGIRVRNADELASGEVGAPEVVGLTIVTDQAAYVQGHFNRTEKKPAAFLADSINVLSENWNDANSDNPLVDRVPTATTVQAAFLAGTDVTGGAEGVGGQDDGEYNGGLENYPRFHENWNGAVPFTYVGSFVSLNAPRHVNGLWVYGSVFYTAPVRVWSYDEDFDSAENLPPLSPRFVYLRQELFVRQFDQ